jgi:hypothetical protein
LLPGKLVLNNKDVFAMLFPLKKINEEKLKQSAV